MDEKYDLKWKTYTDHLVGVFKELGEDGNFADVTLVSDDQVQTKAHKVVLSACSPVLKTLLVNNPHSHPLLYLRGIKQTELQAILKFMYFGETQIFEDRINDFISVAKDLEVKEISKKKDDEIETTEETQNIEAEEEVLNTEELVAEGTTLKTEKNIERTIARSRQRSIANSEGSFSCDECEAKFTRADSLRTHKKSKHEGERFYCNKCEAAFTKASSLKTHKESKHAGVRYSCIECGYQATTPSSLTVHTN